MAQKFFPERPDVDPRIYVYSMPDNAGDLRRGELKVGYTTRTVVERIHEQSGAMRINPKILLDIPAVKYDGTYFKDHDVHRVLRGKGVINTDGEWFKTSLNDVKAAILAVQSGDQNVENRTQDFKMRPEQLAAVEQTAHYFNEERPDNSDKTPHFLWNAKMRFGKTFTSYQLAKKMEWKRVLVLTFKPAVENAWEEDLKSHVDFEGWQFISNHTINNVDELDQDRPIVAFGSFQDYLGKNKAGGIKAKNEWVHKTNWDAVVFDEYHYGAWRESARDLFEGEEREEEKYAEGEGMEYFEEDNMPIK
ncbi:MAG: GIY-YIG nuclease family protein, partial [Candidatus Saccharibacteria bacterium]